MRLFFRKKTFSDKERELIEKIESRIARLIKEWDESYENQPFLFENRYESFGEGIVRNVKHEFTPHLHIVENEPKIGYMIVPEEKRVYKKLWKDMIRLYLKIPKLIKKGKVQFTKRILRKEIAVFEKKVIELKNEEIKRWDSRLRGLYEYLTGKGIDHLTLPVNEYDKKRLLGLYRWTKIKSECFGRSEARELINEAKFLKKHRVQITNRILLVCKAMRNDLIVK